MFPLLLLYNLLALAELDFFCLRTSAHVIPLTVTLFSQVTTTVLQTRHHFVKGIFPESQSYY